MGLKNRNLTHLIMPTDKICQALCRQKELHWVFLQVRCVLIIPRTESVFIPSQEFTIESVVRLPAKAFSFPVNTIAPIPSSSSNFFRASFSSSNKGELKALRALGRLSVTIGAESQLSNTNRSYAHHNIGTAQNSNYCILCPTPGLGVEVKIY